ncbi:gluconate 2-dehydrogenase subunit 3 family protein [Halioxenophilus aromaticivorans]|uniref:Lactose 3-dehydrogenase subunit gamma LacC n=1 Tax=Halioxenophilus aromaticivorans TaxID=1306992 RepID=A0AAV3TXS7_9ALTE
MSSKDLLLINRRNALKAAATVLGSAMITPTLVAAVLAKPAATNTAERSLSPAACKLLVDMCDVILPRTDTPGAVDVGVPDFIISVISNQFKPVHQDRFLLGLTFIESRIKNSSFAKAGALPDLIDVAALETLDREALVEGLTDPIHSTYRELKSLILVGYYTSEPGATKELKYEAVPGAYRGCVPYDSVGSAWATR